MQILQCDCCRSIENVTRYNFLTDYNSNEETYDTHDICLKCYVQAVRFKNSELDKANRIKSNLEFIEAFKELITQQERANHDKI
jgi:hypothetical protein